MLILKVSNSNSILVIQSMFDCYCQHMLNILLSANFFSAAVNRRRYCTVTVIARLLWTAILVGCHMRTTGQTGVLFICTLTGVLSSIWTCFFPCAPPRDCSFSGFWFILGFFLGSVLNNVSPEDFCLYFLAFQVAS